MTSIQVSMHIVLKRDYGKCIQDDFLKIMQRMKYRFNGQFAFFRIKNEKELRMLQFYLEDIIDLIIKWGFMQIVDNFNISDLIKNYNTSFIYNPTLKNHLNEIVYNELKGVPLQNIDVYGGIMHRMKKY